MRRPTLESVAGVMTVAVSALVAVQLLDTVTRGALRRRVAGWASSSRDRLAPRPRVPSPQDVTAVLSEAARITREASET